jgi:hypothetical protein
MEAEMGWFRNLGQRRPWAQGCILAAAGLVLAGTSCVGMLLTYDMNSRSALGQVLTAATTIVFFGSLLALPAGLVWFIVGLVKNAARGGAPPSPPAPPPAAPEPPA